MGSCHSRCSHSTPCFCIHRGARLTCPAAKLKLIPTPSHHARGSVSRSWMMSFSCFGLPNATKTTSGPLARSSSVRAAMRAVSYSNPRLGQWVPTIWMPG